MALPRTTELPGVLFLAALFLAGCFAEQPEKKPTLDLMQLTPGATADTAILTGLRAGKVEIAAQYAGVRKTVNYIFVK